VLLRRSGGLLRRMYRPNGEEARGGWRKLHNEELHKIYTSSDVIGVIKSRRVGWAGYVARMGEMINI